MEQRNGNEINQQTDTTHILLMGVKKKKDNVCACYKGEKNKDKSTFNSPSQALEVNAAL